MSIRQTALTVFLLPALILAGAGGCATTGTSGQMQQLTSANYRTLQKLDTQLTGSLERMNQTSADLAMQLQETDRQTRAMQSLVQENQVKLAALEAKIDTLTRTLYDEFGLTPPRDVTPYGETRDSGVIVVPPPAPVFEDTRPAVPESLDVAPRETPVPAERPEEPAPQPERTVAPGDPANAIADYQKIQTSYVQGDYEDVIKQVNVYLERYPTSEPAASAQFWKAQAYLRMGDDDAAIREFERFRSTYPGSGKEAFSLRNQAAIHLRRGENNRALALLRQLVADWPDDAAADGVPEKIRELEGGN